MIGQGEGFIVRHRSGRYFQSRSHWETIGNSRSHDPTIPMVMFFNLVESPFDADLVASKRWCGGWLESDDWASVADQFEVRPGPGCQCCGERWGAMLTEGEQHRCPKHHGRNPCAIEGCRCTTARGVGRELRDDQFLCSKHWRPLTIAAERRVYQRIWRLAKARERKLGREHMWPMSEIRRLERVWDRIVAKARSRAAGDIDMDEINKMFGWDGHST